MHIRNSNSGSEEFDEIVGVDESKQEMENDEKLDKILEMLTETTAEVKKINSRIENLEVGELNLRKDYEQISNELMMMKKEIK